MCPRLQRSRAAARTASGISAAECAAVWLVVAPCWRYQVIFVGVSTSAAGVSRFVVTSMSRGMLWCLVLTYALPVRIRVWGGGGCCVTLGIIFDTHTSGK